jgi:hypothetical protein
MDFILKPLCGAYIICRNRDMVKNLSVSAGRAETSLEGDSPYEYHAK